LLDAGCGVATAFWLWAGDFECGFGLRCCKTVLLNPPCRLFQSLILTASILVDQYVFQEVSAVLISPATAVAGRLGAARSC
jgi:hypothetical protein